METVTDMGGACIAHEDDHGQVLVFLNAAEGIDEEVVCEGRDVQVEFSREARSGVKEASWACEGGMCGRQGCRWHGRHA